MHECEVCACREKKKPRDPKQLKSLQNRLNRIIGQLSGIGNMLENNRYCGDVLTQIAAAQSALEALGSEILREHMMTCVRDGVREGDDAILEEAFELMRKLRR